MQNLHNPQGVKKLSLSLKTVDTDWIDGGPVVVTSDGASPTKGSGITRDKIWWRRRGDSMEIRTEYHQNGAGNSGPNGITYLLHIPSGYTIDLSKVASYTSFVNMINCVGTFTGHTGGSNRLHGNVQVYDSNKVLATYIGYGGGTTVDEAPWGTHTGSSVNATFGSSGFKFSMHFTVPILGWSTHDASAVVVGSVASKTDMEQQNPGKTVTANNARFNPGVAKAWVSFSAITTIPVIGSSFNVSSITDDGAGKFTINFIQPFSSTDYVLSGAARGNANESKVAHVGLRSHTIAAKTVSSCAIQVTYGDTQQNADCPEITVVFHGNQ